MTMDDGWPWMKDATPCIEPIPPVCDLDKRPIVKDLIQEHREIIDQVKLEITEDPLYNENKHDDLFILRFVLTHNKKKKDIAKAVKHTLAFRKEHKLDERDIRAAPPGSQLMECDPLRRFYRHCDDDALQWAVLPGGKQSRGVVTILRYKGVRQRDLVANVQEEDWLPTFLYSNEWAHQWVDYISRTTGRLTKNVRLLDLTGMKLSENYIESHRRDAKVMNLMEDCYPQLLEKIFILSPPSWINVAWRVFRPIIPKRVFAKIAIIDPTKNEKERQQLFYYLDEEHLPTQYGGKHDPWPVKYPLQVQN